MANTSVLSLVRWEPDSPVTGNAFYNTKEVTRILGTKFRNMSTHELLDQMNPGDCTENYNTPGRHGLNPTEGEMKEIAKITDDLCAGADLLDMEKDKVEKSVRLWYVVQKALVKYDCNAFTAPCPDFCSTRRALTQEVTFCLTHSLNTEIGVPSSCEGDLPTLLSIQLLMSASGCGTFMGECTPMIYRDGVATLPHSPLNPDCDKLFLAKGTIVASNNYNAKNCTLAAVFQVKDIDDFYNKQLDFAQHMPMTYGDHTEVLKRFAKSVGLEVVEA